MKISDKAPISATQRKQLETDAKAVRATAERKELMLNVFEERRETEVARDQFELGCWLYYYSRRVASVRPDGLKDRVQCALLLFLSGICNPRYDFFTVFDFGERQFDTIFEMGDGDKVVDALRQQVSTDKSGMLLKAFKYHGWPLNDSVSVKKIEAGLGQPDSNRQFDLDFAVRINSASLIGGDQSSIAVIYNNLAGLNRLPGEDYVQYLEYMGNKWCEGVPVKHGDLLEYLVDGQVVTRCRIGDKSPVRVTDALLAMCSVRRVSTTEVET